MSSFAFRASCRAVEKLMPARSERVFSQLGMVRVFFTSLDPGAFLDGFQGPRGDILGPMLHFIRPHSLSLSAVSIIARVPTCVNPRSRAGRRSQLRQLPGGGHPHGEALQLTQAQQHHGVVLQDGVRLSLGLDLQFLMGQTAGGFCLLASYIGRDVGTSNSVTPVHCCFHRLIFCPFL